MKVAVLGAACTRFGELWDKSLNDLLAEAQLKALDDAKLGACDIQSIVVGNMCAGMLCGQVHLGSMAAECIHAHCPSMVVEGACASGALALRTGIAQIQAGFADVVMVSGVEKMTDVPASQATTALMGAASEEFEHFVGATIVGLNALVMRLYMQHYELTRQQCGAVSVKNHKHGLLNPLAHFQREVSLHDVLTSTLVADPLTVLDCAPLSDGAACLILSSHDFAQYYAKKYPDNKIVYSVGSGQATDTLAFAQRASLFEFKATQQAAQFAYTMASVGPSEIDVAEVHDAFTFLELMALEDLGFYPKGQAGVATQQGLTSLGCKRPINVSGGLKAKGHPVGASGLSQAYEVVQQLRGQAGKRQVVNAHRALTHSMGGCGTTVVVHIFEKG